MQRRARRAEAGAAPAADNSTFKFLMTAQKKKSKTANYHISADKVPPPAPAAPPSARASAAG